MGFILSVRSIIIHIAYEAKKKRLSLYIILYVLYFVSFVFTSLLIFIILFITFLDIIGFDFPITSI